MFAETGVDVLSLLAFAAMPFVVAIPFAILVNYLRRSSAEHYCEYLCQPLDPAELPRRTRDRFDQHAVDFCRLGFDRVEDARLQEKPCRHDLRLLLNGRGDIWGQINVAKNFWTVLKCISVFDDGMRMESASTPPIRQPEPQDRIQWNWLFCGKVEEIYREHIEAVARYKAETGAEVLAFGPEDAHQVLTYERRLYWHWCRRLGLTKELVPERSSPDPADRRFCRNQPLVR